MKDEDKTKDQLIKELVELRQLITELKASESKHKRAVEDSLEDDKQYRNLAESLNELVYRANPNTYAAKYVNASINKIYGYTVEEWLNDPDLWEKTIHPEDKEKVIEEFTEAHRKIKNTILEYRILRKDGSVRWVRDRISWEKNQQGAVVALTGVVYDITERKKIEKTLIKKMEELVKYYKMSCREYKIKEITEEIEELIPKISGNKKYTLYSLSIVN
jgi:PAS domain S-box-containing protein